MTERELDKLTNEDTIAMLKEIDKNYDIDLPIVEPVYKNDKLTNEKEVRESLKKVLPILLILWQRNNDSITKFSVKTMSSTRTYYNVVRIGLKVPKTPISSVSWEKTMSNILKDRQNKIKIKQVIRGNAKRLNKKVQSTVMKMYKEGKNYKQTVKELQKEFGYNANKAKSIAITEKNYYKSEAQLELTKDLTISKTWVHNSIAKEPRQSHINASGQTVIGRDTYFNVGGYKTLAPQHFGLPSQDINCHCTMRIDVNEE